jgi:hypothetical protein
MGRSLGFVLLIIVVAVGAYIYTRQAESVSAGGAAPNTVIDVTAVRSDLLGIANAERRHFASNGKYASLQELRTSGDTLIPTRESYSYSVETTDTTFKATASYSGSDPKAPKHITIDETMALTTN